MTRNLRNRPAPAPLQLLDPLQRLDRLLSVVTADLRRTEADLAETRARLERAERINAALWELVELASLAGGEWLEDEAEAVEGD